jgi:hypothetical protein
MALAALCLACAVAGLAGVPVPVRLVWATGVVGALGTVAVRLRIGLSQDRYIALFYLARRAGVPALPFAMLIVGLRSAVVVGLVVAALRFLGGR